LIEALNDSGRSLKGSRILVLGIAYKKNVDDMRESPAVDIMELLHARGAILAYSDPYVPAFPRMRLHRFDLQSVDVTPENLGDYDAVVLATDHDAFDYELIARYARLIIDSRGRYRSPMDKVVNA
jgi:UDP-N-acetyl-D-glucosamine dehydrogenase